MSLLRLLLLLLHQIILPVSISSKCPEHLWINSRWNGCFVYETHCCVSVVAIFQKLYFKTVRSDIFWMWWKVTVVANFLWIFQWKNCENWPHFGKNMTNNAKLCFLCDVVYFLTQPRQLTNSTTFPRDFPDNKRQPRIYCTYLRRRRSSVRSERSLIPCTRNEQRPSGEVWTTPGSRPPQNLPASPRRSPSLSAAPFPTDTKRSTLQNTLRKW